MPLTIDPKYGSLDADSLALVNSFNEPAGCSIIEVGSNEEYVGNILADNGYAVTGYDLREWQQEIPCNHDRRQGDWCLLADDIPSGSVDAVVCLSALEHFGLQTYGDGNRPYLDVVAMEQVRRVLKPGGAAYISVPFGMCHLNHPPHWRVYDCVSFIERLGRGLAMEGVSFFTSGPAIIDGVYRKAFQDVSRDEASRYPGDPPHCTILSKLRKAGK